MRSRLLGIATNLYRKYAPEAVLDPDAPKHWQEIVLYLFVLVAVSVGFLALLLGMYDNIQHDYWYILFACTIGYVGCLLVFFFPEARFEWRAATVCGLIYLIGISIVLTVGPFLSSREWLFAFSIMACILLGWPGAIASMVVSFVTWLGIWMLIKTDFWAHLFDAGKGAHHWLMITIDLLFIYVATALLTTFFSNRIGQSDQAAKSLSRQLLEERNKLAAFNRQLALEIEERKTIAKALQESEEKYRTILETMEDAYFEVDLQGKLTFFNRSLGVQLGYSGAELIGTHFRTLVDGAHAAKLVRAFNKLFRSGSAAQSVDIEIRTRHKGIRILSLLATLVRDGDGAPVKFQGLSRDITENRLMEEHLQRARKMEAVGALAGGVAHDLNNTLSGVVGYPELLLMNLPETDPLRKPIMGIKKSGEKAVAIVQDLLTLARRGVAVKEITNLNTLVHEYLQSTEFHTLKAFHAEVKFETQLAPSLLNISGSPIHLSKSLMNLISNAAEAIKDEGTIFVSTANRYVEQNEATSGNLAEGDYVVLTVRDTGEGIPPEDIDRIFEPFFTKKVMGRSGTGLGMAVVWGTVEDHGGHIDVRSGPGRGTTFTIHLPATREAVLQPTPTLSVADYRGHGERILIVDDVATQREVASKMLTVLGYAPEAVDSGLAAVAHCKTHKVDLLLLDMIMRPGIDGLETYKRILALHPGQKAIIASGYSETERIKETLRLGAGAYLKKPYSMEKLGLAVKNALSSEPTQASEPPAAAPSWRPS
ncbi:hybrid sensor histidine kinase/response regulator [Desulfatitalea alkaliphila]|uniref:histidine kinase n=1 Tax=Desulfatitalea alkaliphila TaxID=2929485 RepID=A0AA41R586_9BACT|nr:ATP-binding protein [Desulfatitalea alkaliphila]MCJ8501200.1 ATP-binding protein [Desulfatitalea alkaliphila]